VTEPMIPDDDVAMSLDERTTWVYLVTVVVTAGGYFAVVGSRAAGQPIEDVSWVAPMLWAIGISIAVTVLGAIVAAVVGSVGIALGGRDRDVELGSDVRDREIGRTGDRASMTVTAIGFAVALVLSMVDADTFWIGNSLFLFGALGAVAETITKIRLYRRGF